MKTTELWKKANGDGDLGEALIRHFLLSRGILAHTVGHENFPADLIIPVPDGSYFEKKAVIQVKTETASKKLQDKHYFYPSESGIEKIKDTLQRLNYGDYGLWIAFVWAHWAGSQLMFRGCLFPTDMLSDEDFLPSKRGIYFWRIWEKAPIKLEGGKEE